MSATVLSYIIFFCMGLCVGLIGWVFERIKTKALTRILEDLSEDSKFWRTLYKSIAKE